MSSHVSYLSVHRLESQRRVNSDNILLLVVMYCMYLFQTLQPGTSRLGSFVIRYGECQLPHRHAPHAATQDPRREREASIEAERRDL
jgi:hypothetical protein